MKLFGTNPLNVAVAALAVSSNFLKPHAAPVAAKGKNGVVPQAKAHLNNVPRDVDYSTIDYSKVDYSKVDWSTVDYSKVDWNTVSYGNNPTPVPPAPTSQSAQPAPPAPTTTQSAQPVPPAPTTLVTWVAPPTPPAPAPAPTTTQAAPAPVPTTSQQQPPAPAPTGINWGALNPNAYSITAINRSNKQFNVGFFEDLAPFQPTFTTTNQAGLQPGQNFTLTVVQGWAGRVQKLLAGAGDPATWAELSFVGGTWYDASYIRGNNGQVVMSTENGGVAGTSEDLFTNAPSKVQDSAGNTVLDATESYTGTVDDALVAYYRAHNDGNGYVRNFDNGAVRTGPGKNVVVEIY